MNVRQIVILILSITMVALLLINIFYKKIKDRQIQNRLFKNFKEMEPKNELDYIKMANEIYESINGLSTDEIKLFNTIHRLQTKEQLNKLIDTYFKIYRRDMISDIDDDLQGSFSWFSNLPAVKKKECEHEKTEKGYFYCLINNLK